ncbi:MAG: hypothetical protein KDJ47_04145 [Hyphomicrobiaceae bacterium]|nr:hypothetical protein [Hyphomicrobiaceae bacterium]
MRRAIFPLMLVVWTTQVQATGLTRCQIDALWKLQFYTLRQSCVALGLTHEGTAARMQVHRNFLDGKCTDEDSKFADRTMLAYLGSVNPMLVKLAQAKQTQAFGAEVCKTLASELNKFAERSGSTPYVAPKPTPDVLPGRDATTSPGNGAATEPSPKP